MNVVTGETGAGKSILVDALQLVLGGARAAGDRAHRAPSRPRSRRCSTSATTPRCARGSRPPGIDGRGRARAAARGPALGPLARLRERQPAPRPASSRSWRAGCATSRRSTSTTRWSTRTRTCGYLDAFAELSRAARADARGATSGWRSARRAAGAAATPPSKRVEREDLLRFQIAEIDALGAEGRRGEPALTVERDRMRHAERLARRDRRRRGRALRAATTRCARGSRGSAPSSSRRPTLDPALAPLCRAARRRARAARRRGARARQLRARRRARRRAPAGARGAPRRDRAAASASTAAASRPCSRTARARPRSWPRSISSEQRSAELQRGARARAASAPASSRASCRAGARRRPTRLAKAVSRELASLVDGRRAASRSRWRSPRAATTSCASTARG